ncbi:DUF4167 domain-containing protein [uncultured Litoreibacter sp.]|uniref:DUF4167 domain-containing protein n=1 Tax=uncultured Litoreibacter sp. TaxID=1392394 RepID=UPI00262D9BEB|nr:DUF4167 domain-containing protein [uncultured Litoreibacter sp.]
MRSQKSRSRGKNRNNNRSNVNIVNRVFDSSGPEGKVRGTPQQIIEKYQQLHRDAQLSGDRVAAENFQQHAEHYARMLADAMKEQEAKREAHEAQQAAQRERQQRDAQHQQNKQDQAGQNTGGDQPKQDKPRRERKPRQDGDRDGLERVLGGGDQPDVIDMGGAEDSGLVETVEAAPKPARKPRTRKPKPAAEAPAADDQSAAE